MSTEFRALESQLEVSNRLRKGWRRYWLVFLGTLECVVTGAVVFGWSSLLLMLLHEGVYRDLCAPGLSECPAQLEALNNIYVVASSAFAFAAWPSGAILDRFGPKISCCLGAVLFGTGSALFAFAGPNFDVFLPGFLLISLGGPPITLAPMSFTTLFPRRSGTVVTLFFVGLDASAVEFMLFDVLNYSGGVSRRFLFLCLVAFSAFVFLAALLWYPSRPYLQPQGLGQGENESEGTAMSSPCSSPRSSGGGGGGAGDSDDSPPLTPASPLLDLAPAAATSAAATFVAAEKRQQAPGVRFAADGSLRSYGATTDPSAAASPPGGVDYDILVEFGDDDDILWANGAGRHTSPAAASSLASNTPLLAPLAPLVTLTPREARKSGGGAYGLLRLHHYGYGRALGSPYCWLSLLFSTLIVFRLNFFIGSVHAQLLSMAHVGGSTGGSGGSALVNEWTLAFGWILPLSEVLTVPLVGWLIDTQPHWRTVMLLNAASLAFGALNLLPLPLYLQPIPFSLFGFLTGFTFSAMSAYTLDVFGVANFGKLWGTMYVLVGCLNFAQTPLMAVVNGPLHGQFALPNAALTALSLLMFAFPLWLWRAQRRLVTSPRLRSASHADIIGFR